MSFTLTQEQIDTVEQLLARESNASGLADQLFSPEGLFPQWTKTEDERRAVTKLPIFKKAQARFRELQTEEAARFARAVETVARKGESELFKWDGLTPLSEKG